MKGVKKEFLFASDEHSSYKEIVDRETSYTQRFNLFLYLNSCLSFFLLGMLYIWINYKYIYIYVVKMSVK